MGNRAKQRSDLYGYGLPASLLPRLSSLSGLLPAAGPDDIQARNGEGSRRSRSVAISAEAEQLSMEETPDGSASLASLDSCNLCFEAEDDWPEEVSARPDAAAVVPLQPGVRRLREDSIPRAHPEGGALARGLLQGG